MRGVVVVAALALVGLVGGPAVGAATTFPAVDQPGVTAKEIKVGGTGTLSIWRDGVCAATFRMDRAASAELVGDLVRSLSLPVEITWSDRQLSGRRPRVRERLAAMGRFVTRRPPV